MSYDTNAIMTIVGLLKDTLRKLKKAEDRIAIKDDAIRDLERSLRDSRDNHRGSVTEP